MLTTNFEVVFNYCQCLGSNILKIVENHQKVTKK